MKFKTVYVIVIFFAVLGFVLPLTRVQDTVIYWMHGYDPGLINGSSAESYAAFYQTLFTRQVLDYFERGSSILCLAFAIVAIYHRVFVAYYISYLVLFLCIIMLAVFWIASIIPRGMLG